MLFLRHFAIGLCAALAFTSLAARADDAVGGGPQHILITYRSEAAQRPAFRTYLAHTEDRMLAKLQAQGVLKGYQILFNPFATTGTWDAMVILDFTSFAATQRWQEIERTMPAGLDKAGLKLAKPYRTYSCDLFREGASDMPGDASKHVMYVIPYSYNAADQYKSYVDGYVIPQVKGWIKEGVLSRYRIYMNRYQVGEPEPWDSLFIYDYRDLDSFGRRDETVAKVRGPLREDPVWKHLNDIKATIRSESENTITELVAPRP
jgi:DNA-binding Lrp family transcriptional regulator